MTIEDIEKICEKRDFNTIYDENAWQDKAGLTISQYTPAGEDWSEILEASSVGDFVGNLEKRIENWDIDEEVEPYIDMRGRNGIPSSIRELLEDAEWKLNTLKELLADIKTAMANDTDTIRSKDESKESSSEKTVRIKIFPDVGDAEELDITVPNNINTDDYIEKWLNKHKKFWNDYKIIKTESYQKNLDESKELKTEEKTIVPVSELPDMCYGVLPSDCSIIVIKKGEKGYYTTNKNYESEYADIEDYNEKCKKADELCNRLNAQIDVTPEQRQSMEIRSMFGNWEDKKEEAVTPDKEYMGIKYFDNKDGKCPVCDANLYYDAVEHVDSDMEYYPWVCEKCGARGEAWFKEVFQGHTIITPDTDDNIDLPFDADE